MVNALGFFKGKGVFTEQDDNTEVDVAERLIEPIDKVVNDMYDGFAQSCLRRADGDQMKADYLFDCNYWEYYFRVKQYNDYKESMKPKAES